MRTVSHPLFSRTHPARTFHAQCVLRRRTADWVTLPLLTFQQAGTQNSFPGIPSNTDREPELLKEILERVVWRWDSFYTYSSIFLFPLRRLRKLYKYIRLKQVKCKEHTTLRWMLLFFRVKGKSDLSLKLLPENIFKGMPIVLTLVFVWGLLYGLGFLLLKPSTWHSWFK